MIDVRCTTGRPFRASEDVDSEIVGEKVFMMKSIPATIATRITAKHANPANRALVCG